jgi:hypothetical protein
MKYKSIPSIVRTLGWVVFALGIMTTLGGLFGLVLLPVFMRLSEQLSAATGVPRAGPDFTGMWFWEYRYPVNGFNLLFGLLQTFAGYGLAQGREWARVTLMVMAMVMIPWQAAGPVMMGPMMRPVFQNALRTYPVQSQDQIEAMMRVQLPMMMAMSTVMALGWIVLLIFFVRWLNGPMVRAACAPEPAAR